MRCRRCRGLMVREWCSEFFDWEACVWKCVNCGAVLDPVICQNKRAGAPESRLAQAGR